MKTDQFARQKAIDVSQSYIVQAPAGSGKTELLTQRVLNLLTQVNNPEEVVAITFTRKAAREMQQRIIESLQAATKDIPSEEHKKITWRLASKVLKRNAELSWGLLYSPHRLRIMTFDALCSMITNKMPVLARFGSQVSPSDSPMQLYQDAAKAVLEGIKFKEDWSEAIQILLKHTDNKLTYLQQLLAEQLAKRDQWYRLIGEGCAERELLEQGFVEAIQLKLQQAQDAISEDQKERLLELIYFTASYLDDSSPLSALRNIQSWPETSIDNIAAWQAIANFCLNKGKKDFRTKGQVPTLSSAESKQQKDDVRDIQNKGKVLFTELKDNLDFANYLHQLRGLPEVHYQESQWQVIEALIQLMQIAGAHLTLQFKKAGEVDFTEVSMAAERALGELNEPSDLALKLDYAISHILVDEFQDTSFAQFHLLEKLTSGWQVNEGKTLFIVGDPMQSIYRFREANVGLFIQARESGLGSIKLEFLQLTNNFRSSETLVGWVNKAFASIFPKHDDPVLGAVSLAKANATIDSKEQDGVYFESFFAESEVQEAEHIGQQVSLFLDEYPNDNIAILVRARNHAQDIAHQLRQQNIIFQAEQMESLASQQQVVDLLTLSRILLHPLDKIAWIGFLKSPWLGLSITDISKICEYFGEQIFKAFDDYLNVPGLSELGVSTLSRQSLVVTRAIERRNQESFSVQLEQVWLQLGGPLSITEQQDLEHTYAFFDLLVKLERQHLIYDFEQIEGALHNLYAEPEYSENCRVNIMTMHKAKGLEFDTVFLPKLSKSISNNSKSLMVWEEFAQQDNSINQYLIAPINQAAESQSLYKLVNDFSNEKDRLESARLLYVAATRAKKRLYLTAEFKHKHNKKLEKEVVTSLAKDSLMHWLQPIYKTAIESALISQKLSKEKIVSEQTFDQQWPRLKRKWKYPVVEDPLFGLVFEKEKTLDNELNAELEYDWATDIAMLIGTIIHRQLELVSKQHWTLSERNIEEFASQTKSQLITDGYSSQASSYAYERIVEGLSNVMIDEVVQWILAVHNEHASELAITGIIDDQYRSYVIDRTFVDDNGVRWIIDYKTGTHLEENKHEFIKSEVKRYRPQLQQYEFLMKQLDDRPIKKALYFPMLKELVEIK